VCARIVLDCTAAADQPVEIVAAVFQLTRAAIVGINLDLIAQGII
jgi:hypothetical protein